MGVPRPCSRFITFVEPTLKPKLVGIIKAFSADAQGLLLLTPGLRQQVSFGYLESGQV